MATNIKTVMTYPLNGSTTDFNIPFEYLARKFVQVTLIGVDRKVLVLNQEYRFATKAIISTTKAWGPADGYQLIEIRRYTSATERLVDFTDGSILRAYDLNISQVQTLHVAEEARDLTADTIGVNNDGNLDARGRRIVNIGDGVGPGDAITLGQVTRWNESALNSKNAAKVSETNSKTSETNSKTSENAAHKWAQNPEDAAVVGSEYSAYHYSRKASKSAAASEASAVRSDSSAAKSLASETNAKTSETNAKTSETAAGISATNAKADADRAQSANPDNQLKKANNLSDVGDRRTALANLMADTGWRNWNDPAVLEFITWRSDFSPRYDYEIQVRVTGDFIQVKGVFREVPKVGGNWPLFTVKRPPQVTTMSAPYHMATWGGADSNTYALYVDPFSTTASTKVVAVGGSVANLTASFIVTDVTVNLK